MIYIGDWLIFFVIGTLGFLLALLTIRYLRLLYLRKRKAGYVFLPSDVHWNYAESGRLLVLS